MKTNWNKITLKDIVIYYKDNTIYFNIDNKRYAYTSQKALSIEEVRTKATEYLTRIASSDIR